MKKIVVVLVFISSAFAFSSVSAQSLPTPTPAPALAPAISANFPPHGVVTDAANLRSGPGVSNRRIGSLPAGANVTITACNDACDWYKLDSGAWIAGFLVAPAGEPQPASADVGATATTEPQVTDDEKVDAVLDEIQGMAEIGVTKTCDNFEYKLTDVRRKKSVWLFDNEYVAHGEWLLVFFEVKNIGSGTDYFGRISPRLFVGVPEHMDTVLGNAKASGYASWMFQHGRFYGDINPGQSLGVVEAYDLPANGETLMGIGFVACPGTENKVFLGEWSRTPQAEK